MTPTRCMGLIGIATLLGVAKVAQQTAITLSAYHVGYLYAKAHQAENETVWLRMRVAALQSPIHLAETMNQHDLALVAWSELSDPGAKQMASAGRMGHGTARADE